MTSGLKGNLEQQKWRTKIQQGDGRQTINYAGIRQIVCSYEIFLTKIKVHGDCTCGVNVKK